MTWNDHLYAWLKHLLHFMNHNGLWLIYKSLGIVYYIQIYVNLKACRSCTCTTLHQNQVFDDGITFYLHFIIQRFTRFQQQLTGKSLSASIKQNIMFKQTKNILKSKSYLSYLEICLVFLEVLYIHKMLLFSIRMIRILSSE